MFSEDGKPAKCLSLKIVGKRKLWNYCCSTFTFQRNNISPYYLVRAYILFWSRDITFLTCPSTLFLCITRYRVYRHGYLRFPICIHYKASIVLGFVLFQEEICFNVTIKTSKRWSYFFLIGYELWDIWSVSGGGWWWINFRNPLGNNNPSGDDGNVINKNNGWLISDGKTKIKSLCGFSCWLSDLLESQRTESFHSEGKGTGRNAECYMVPIWNGWKAKRVIGDVVLTEVPTVKYMHRR